MNINEAMSFINSYTKSGGRITDLSRAQELADSIGNPEKRLRFVHIAGTNGKGSTLEYISNALIMSGYKVGQFTSPFILRYNDRIRINGEEISDEALAEIAEQVKSRVSDRPYSQFEITMAIAFLWFERENCDIVILETGIGGLLDCTNVIPPPLLSVITSISLDHTALLGNTVEEIAAHKAGIIKQDCPAYFGGRDSDALAVISKRAKQLGAPLALYDDSPLSDISYSLDGISFRWNGENYMVPLCGTYQRDNIVNLMCCVEILRKHGMTIDTDSLRKGLAETVWQGRFEVMYRDPYVVYDGAHNPDGIAKAAESIEMYFPDKAVLLIGVMADKDYRLYADMLGRFIEKVYTVTPDNPRALDSAALAEVFADKNIPAESFEYLPDGVSAAYYHAKEKGLPLIALGSLYMYREFREAMKHILDKTIST